MRIFGYKNIILGLLTISVANCLIYKKINLILNIFKQYNTKTAICLLCWNELEKTTLLKSIYLNSYTKTIILPADEEMLKSFANLYKSVTFVVDLDCPKTFDVMQKDFLFNMFDANKNWILLHNSSKNTLNISEVLSGINLRLDSNILIAILKEDNYQIFYVYKLGSIVIKMGFKFINQTLIKLNTTTTFYEERKILRNVLLKTASTYNSSFKTDQDVAREMRKRGDHNFDKFNFQLFLSLKDIHKFNYNTTFRNAYFGNLTSGIDGGIAQLLHEKKVDISTSGGFLRVARIEYYDFLVPVYKFRTCFIFVNPGKTKLGTEVLKPFSTNTWLVFVLTALCIGIGIYVACWADFVFENTQRRNSLFTSMIVTISVFSQQGSAIVPIGNAGRIIFLNLLVLSIIIYNYYTSSLVSSLLSNVPEAISTIKELYESNLKVAIHARPYTITYFLQQKHDKYISLLNSSKVYENGVANFMEPDEGLLKVKEGTHAYHTEVSIAYSWLEIASQDVICDLAEINFIPNSDIGLVLPKNSEYTELFVISLRKMQTRGIYSREMRYWVPKKPACLLSTRVKAVGCNEIFLVYVILCCGTLLSIFIFIVEILSYKLTTANL